MADTPPDNPFDDEPSQSNPFSASYQPRQSSQPTTHSSTVSVASSAADDLANPFLASPAPSPARAASVSSHESDNPFEKLPDTPHPATQPSLYPTIPVRTPPTPVLSPASQPPPVAPKEAAPNPFETPPAPSAKTLPPTEPDLGALFATAARASQQRLAPAGQLAAAARPPQQQRHRVPPIGAPLTTTTVNKVPAPARPPVATVAAPRLGPSQPSSGRTRLHPPPPSSTALTSALPRGVFEDILGASDDDDNDASSENDSDDDDANNCVMVPVNPTVDSDDKKKTQEIAPPPHPQVVVAPSPSAPPQAKVLDEPEVDEKIDYTPTALPPPPYSFIAPTQAPSAPLLPDPSSPSTLVADKIPATITSTSTAVTTNTTTEPLPTPAAPPRPLPLTTSSAIASLLRRAPIQLDSFRSLESKQALLSCACASHDGSTITQVVLFLQRTLAASLFASTLTAAPPTAKAHYYAHLTRHGHLLQLETVQRSLNEPLSAALTMHTRARLPETLPDASVSLLAAASALVDPTAHSFMHQRLTDHCELLRRQIPLESQDATIAREAATTAAAKAAKAGKGSAAASIIANPHAVPSNVLSETAALTARFLALPRPPAPVLPHATLGQTLTYCLRYHSGRDPERLASPANLKASFRVSDALFAHLALIEFCSTRNFAAIQKLFTVPGSFFRSASLKSPIGWETVVRQCGRARAPTKYLELFIRQLPTPLLRVQACEAFHGLANVAIDALVDLRDHQRAIEFRDRRRAKGDAAAAQAVDAAIADGRIK